MTGPTQAPPKPTARQRLLAAADELFYTEGVNTVGIDRIIERAGVAKASLYTTFGSKEKLIEAYLQARHSNTTARLKEAIDEQADPRARLLAIFDAQAQLFREPGFRGCAFVTASAEAPAGGLVEHAADEFRADIGSLFRHLTEEIGAADPDTLARQLQLIYDGAALAARMDRNPAIAAAAKQAAETLLNADPTDTAVTT